MLPECKELLLSLDGGVLSITLNRPHKRNAMNKRLVDEMRAVFAAIAEHRSVRAVVLRGAEGNFCAGGDIAGMHDGAVDEAGKPLSPDKAAWQFNRSFGHLITEVNKAPQVVITILEGAVLGGGFGLACVSDIAIAKADAKFAMPETGLGIVPAQIAPFVVMRVGLTQARRLALTGQRIEHLFTHLPGAAHFRLGNLTHHAARLGRPHHRNHAAWPCEHKAWLHTAAAHRVVTCAVGTADNNTDFRHRGIGDRLNQFRAMLDDPALFRFGADNKAGGVMEKNYRRLGLLAKLNKLPGLRRPLGSNRAVIANHCTGNTLNRHMTADRANIESTFEFQEV